MDWTEPTRVRDVLEAAFPEPDVLAVTERGLWLATPVRVLAAALEALTAARLMQPQGARILDAGAGDGRLLGVFGALGAAWGLDLIGIETSGQLVEIGRQRLAALRSAGHLESARIRFVSGDYLSSASYEALGHSIAEIDCIFNYPDGNETRLEELVERAGATRARLVLLGPDRQLRFRRLETAWAGDIPTATGAPTWRMIVSRPAASRVSGNG